MEGSLMVERNQPPQTDLARIEISHLTKRFMTKSGEPFTAINDVSLTVEPGQFCAIVGPTGCGKSTTLGQVSGLERPSGGSVKVGGHEVDGITEGVSFLFQNDALFPWKSLLGNVMIGPTLTGMGKKRPSRCPATGCGASGWRGSRTATRTNSRVACESGSRWPRRSSTLRGSY